MYDGMKRLQIQQLREAGVSSERTASAAEVSSRTVVRVTAEDSMTDPAAHDASARARTGRPSKFEPHKGKILAWLKTEPGIQSIAILERLREEGYDGGKSGVYEFVRKHRPPKAVDGVVRFEAVPGEFVQHDFGQLQVRYQDGTEERIRFFASQLRYSRMVRVLVVPNETVETICHSVVDAYEYFGGMPLIGVFDNPRTIVTKREGKHVSWQETFAWFTVECGFSPHVTWPYLPREKGGVENLVGFVKSSFFKVHKFVDREDMLRRLAAWHVRTNDERPSRATKEIPRDRMALEAPRLRPLKISSGGYTLRYSRTVRTDGFIELHGLRYYAGIADAGNVITVHLGEDHVEVHPLVGAASTHPRRPLNGKYSVLSDQREELLTKEGARPYVKRQLLMEGCPAAEWFMTELRHRRPDCWEEDVDAIFTLMEMHGEETVRGALTRAAHDRLVGAEYVTAIIAGQAAAQGGQS